MKYFILIYLSIFLSSLYAHSSDDKIWLDPSSSLFFRGLELTKENIQAEKKNLERMKRYDVIDAVYGRTEAYFKPENNTTFVNYAKRPVPTLIDLAIEQVLEQKNKTSNKKADRLEAVQFLIDDGAVISAGNILKTIKHPQSLKIFKLLIHNYKKGDLPEILLKINYSELDIFHTGDIINEFKKFNIDYKSLKDNLGRDLLSLSIYGLNPKAASFFIEQGVDSYSIDLEGNTRFHILAQGLTNLKTFKLNPFFEDSSKKVISFKNYPFEKEHNLKIAKMQEYALNILEELSPKKIDLFLKNYKGRNVFEEFEHQKSQLLEFKEKLKHKEHQNVIELLHTVLSIFQTEAFKRAIQPRALIVKLAEFKKPDGVFHDKKVKEVLNESIYNFNVEELEKYTHLLMSIPPKTPEYFELFEKVKTEFEKQTSKPFMLSFVERYSSFEKQTSKPFVLSFIERYSSHKEPHLLEIISGLIPTLSIQEYTELQRNKKAGQVLSNLDLSKIVQECSRVYSFPMQYPPR